MDCPKQMSNRMKVAKKMESINFYRIYFPYFTPAGPPGASQDMHEIIRIK